jgi:hypothetical protein
MKNPPLRLTKTMIIFLHLKSLAVVFQRIFRLQQGGVFALGA